MHGYNQGETMVKFLCDVNKPDVIFLQEHWLSPDRLHELCSWSSEYIFYGISAMNSVLKNDILIGRPFGGVATLVHNSYKQIVISHVSADKFTIVSIGTLVLVNVYLRCSPRGDTLDLLSDLLNEILSILSDIEYDKLLFGGDINCDPSITSNGFTLVNSFVSSLGAIYLVLPTTIMDNLSIAAFTHVQE